MTIVLALTFALGCTACGGDSGSGSQSNHAAPGAQAFNDHGLSAQQHLTRMAELASGEGGYIALATRLREMPLETQDDTLEWFRTHAAFNEQMAELIPVASAFALDALAMHEHRQAYLDDVAANFPWPPPEETAAELDALKGQCLEPIGWPEDPVMRPLLMEGLLVGTIALAGYRAVRGGVNLMNGGQRIVGRTAQRGPEGEAAVRRALEQTGVNVPAGADGQALTALFESQSMRTRIRITSAVNGWVADEVMSGSAVGDDATALAVQSREDIPEIANEAGAYAVEQTVNALQLGQPGLGELAFGTPGAVADFALFATEMTPTDIIRRNATVYVQSPQRIPLPTATSTTPAPVARQVLQQAADSDPDVDMDSLADAADALVRDAADALRRQFGPTIQIAQRVASLRMTLEDTVLTVSQEVYQQADARLPGFEPGDAVDVLILQDNIAPQEEVGHLLIEDNPIELLTPPLLGTLSAEASSAGPVDALGAQPFTVEFSVTRVSQPVSITCRGINAVCQPGSLSLPMAGSGTFQVQVTGRGQVRLLRTDTAEAYVLAVRASDGPPPSGDSAACRDAKAHLCSRLPQVGCDISIMDTARARVINACGQAEAQRFFAEAPGMCC